MLRNQFLKGLFLTSCLITAFSPAWGDVFTSDEIDIGETWLGTAVSTKFGDEEAWHDYDGLIDNYHEIIDCGVAGCAEGSVYANVIEQGAGTVKTMAGLYYHTPGTANLGTSSQSLKPFVISGDGTINSSITITFDGLMVVKESGNTADDWSQARVEYMAAIQQYNPQSGEREDLQVFDGMARVTQDGVQKDSGSATIDVPETFTTDDFPDEIIQNGFYGDVSIQKVIGAGPAGPGEITVADLTAINADAGADANTHITDQRTVYYLVYTETFNFDATAGETYFVYMDLVTAVNASAGNFDATYAKSDFSKTIHYALAGGNGITTSLLFDGPQSIGGNDPFGGAGSVVNADGATFTFTGNANLNEQINLTGGNTSFGVGGGLTADLLGGVGGDGGLAKTGLGTLTLSGTNSYGGGTSIGAGTLALGANNALPQGGTVTVGAGATLDLGGFTQALSGTLGGNGTIAGGGTLTSTGIIAPGASIGTLTIDATTLTQASGSSLEIEFNNTGGAGNVDLIRTQNGGSVVIQSGAKLVPIALEPITQSHTYTFMTDATPISGSFETVVDNYAVLDFAAAKANGDQDYQLTITRLPYSQAASTPASGGVTTALDSIMSTGGAPASIQAIMDALDVMTPDQFAAATEALAPDVTGSAVNAAQTVTGRVQGIVGTRTASLRSGLSAGEPMVANGAGWAQAFYGTADQSNRKGYQGYDARTHGFAAGFDGELDEQLLAGIAYAYGKTDSDSRNSDIESDGHTIMLYGTYDAGPWYADAMLSYGWHEYDSTRATLSGTANGSYDGQQAAARIDAGMPVPVRGGALVATPLASLSYSHLALDDYAESGAGGANLVVEDQSFNTLTAGVGAKLSGTVRQAGQWSVEAEGRAHYTYDVVQDDVSTVARFAAAGPSFTTDGLTPSRHAALLGAGLTFRGHTGLDISVDYNGEARSDYIAHTGMVRLRQSF